MILRCVGDDSIRSRSRRASVCQIAVEPGRPPAITGHVGIGVTLPRSPPLSASWSTRAASCSRARVVASAPRGGRNAKEPQRVARLREKCLSSFLFCDRKSMLRGTFFLPRSLSCFWNEVAAHLAARLRSGVRWATNVSNVLKLESLGTWPGDTPSPTGVLRRVSSHFPDSSGSAYTQYSYG